jgi:hypothetical protein
MLRSISTILFVYRCITLDRKLLLHTFTDVELTVLSNNMIFSSTAKRRNSFFTASIAFLLLPATSGDDGMRPPKDCRELECCGIGTFWDRNGCHADSSDSIGFDFNFPEGCYELGCRLGGW